MKPTDNFKKAIKAYLDDRAKTDVLFATSYAKPGKDINDCCTYIINQVKASGRSAYVPDEVYCMAVHYYDEDNIKVGKPISCKVVVPQTSAELPKVELTEGEKKQAREAALQRLQEETYAALRKPKKVKRVETVEISLSQFKVMQSRGRYNENSEYHDQIVELVNRNMNLIRKRASKKVATPNYQSL